MNWLVYHIASGHAFFTGAALIVVAALVSTYSASIAKRVATLSFLIGVAAIAVSSTPLPYWLGATAGLVTAWWLASCYTGTGRRQATAATAAVWVIAAGLEVSYHAMPTLDPAASRSVAVIGDSITAGTGADDPARTWPTLLAAEQGVTVHDVSHMGETAASALRRVQSNPVAAPIVIIEIGGNDLLGTTSAAQFAQDLDALLAHVSTPGRQLAMFELPLPPFHAAYGRVQRMLARKYGVALLPKRVLLSVLAGEDATLDSIHLTQAGHDRMAARMWQLLQPAMPDAAAE